MKALSAYEQKVLEEVKAAGANGYPALTAALMLVYKGYATQELINGFHRVVYKPAA